MPTLVPLALLLAGFARTVVPALPAQGGQTPPPRPAPTAPASEKPYTLNLRIAEELTLEDLDGKRHDLFAEHGERALVLVFWSWKDPVSRFYVPLLTELQKAHAGKVAILLVNANHDELDNAGDPRKKMREVLAKEHVTLPLLLDFENRLADDFRAVANVEAFVIDANRVLRYRGGVDDDSDGERKKHGIPLRNWLADALEQTLAAQPVKENWTRPAGRPIKRVPKEKARPAGAPK